MGFFSKLLVTTVVVATASVAGFSYWAKQPITSEGAPIPFTVAQGSSGLSAARQIAGAGVPVNPYMLSVLARVTSKASRIKAGSYELKPGATPRKLIDQLVRGEFAQESVTIIEGWTFRQMRQALAAHSGLRHDVANLSETFGATFSVKS